MMKNNVQTNLIWLKRRNIYQNFVSRNLRVMGNGFLKPLEQLQIHFLVELQLLGIENTMEDIFHLFAPEKFQTIKQNYS